MPENFKSLMTYDVDVKPLEKAEHLSLHGGNDFQSKSVQPACRDETSVWQLPANIEEHSFVNLYQVQQKKASQICICMCVPASFTFIPRKAQSLLN